MANPTHAPAGYLALTLHAHLPWVVHHGTWPHGMEWLHEAAAETYLPLLRILGNLERDGIAANLNLNLSPILLEQLSHTTFRTEFPKYLTRKIVAAREDEAFFIQAGENHLAETARFWHRFFATALEDFTALGGRIVDGFRHFQDLGSIEILTSGATHGYMPLLGTDESVRAQVRTAVATHIRHLGRAPRGIWVPECGYRPAGHWDYPVADAGSASPHSGFDRVGLEQALAESGLEYFFVDTHLVEESHNVQSPYTTLGPVLVGATPNPGAAQRSLYHAWMVEGSPAKQVSIFPRDPRTGLQVWSGESGYPGDPNYLDFHKKRFPGGHRYWQVTGHSVDIGDKQPYWPQHAAERVRVHAAHFVSLLREVLEPSFAQEPDAPAPVLTAPFDAELFGHWWFEGPQWVEAVCRLLHQQSTQPSDEGSIAMIQCSQYLDRFPRAGSFAMNEGSWGAEGKHAVWLNPETSWTWSHIYPAERFVREIATEGRWRACEVGSRIARQLCRELLLLESSDWQFLITTGAARDYAEMRFTTHNDQFSELKTMWESLLANEHLEETQLARLAEIEVRDPMFPEIDPGLWAAGAHESGAEAPFPVESSALENRIDQTLTAD
ncbi:MAG: 1,4-alpha-glucan branching protein [Acidobacteriaceae bacterium]